MQKNKYCFIITSFLLSLSFKVETNVIFMLCSGLNGAKKALINGKLYEMLGVSNLSEICKLKNIRGSSRWVNAVSDKDIKKSDHFAFSLITGNVWDAWNFSFSLLNDKAELISFPSSKQKVPVLNFKIQVIKWCD